MYFKEKIGFTAIWIFLTIIGCILISLAQTLAREVTLDNVRAYDFKIIRAAVQHENVFKNSLFTEITSELSARNGSFVLFPLAIIDKVSCNQNGNPTSNNKICEYFGNINEWDRKTKFENINNYYDIRYRFFGNDVYMFAEIDSNKILIGQAGNYLHLHGDDFAQIQEFFTNRLPNNYINSIYGIKVIYYKSKLSMIIFLIGSLIGLIIFLTLTIWKERGHANDLDYAKKLVTEKENQCLLLQQRIDKSNDSLSDKKIKIESLKIQLQNNEIKMESYEVNIDSLLAELIDLEQKHKALQQNLINVESEKHELIINVETATTKINDIQAKDELQSYQSKYNRIIRLWDSSTKWNQRREIEESVNSKQRVPFTLSTAFIAFEAWVDDYYQYLSTQIDCNEITTLIHKKDANEITTLNEKIEVVIKKQPHLRSTLHNIRVARNAWFHNGKVPEKGLITELLSTVNSIEPRI